MRVSKLWVMLIALVTIFQQGFTFDTNPNKTLAKTADVSGCGWPMPDRTPDVDRIMQAEF